VFRVSISFRFKLNQFIHNNLLSYYVIGPGSYSSTGHTRIGSNSFRHGTSSGGDAIGLNPFRNPPNRHTTGSNLFVHKTTSSEYMTWLVENNSIF